MKNFFEASHSLIVKKMFVVFGVFLFCAFMDVSLGATWYVDASRPDDSGDGSSWDTAKKTIQAGTRRIPTMWCWWVMGCTIVVDALPTSNRR